MTAFWMPVVVVVVGGKSLSMSMAVRQKQALHWKTASIKMFGLSVIFVIQ